VDKLSSYTAVRGHIISMNIVKDKVSRLSFFLRGAQPLEIELDKRDGISDDEWTLIGPLLPFERGRVGRGGRPAADNRAYFEGMMWKTRTSTQWRLMPVEFGKWNSVFRRYRRWVKIGVFDALLKSLAETVERDTSVGSGDSPANRAYLCAVGLKNGITKTRLLPVSPLPRI